MSRITPQLPSQFSASELPSLLSRFVSSPALQQAIAQAGVPSQRVRKLPAELTARLVISLGLIGDASSRSVLAGLMPPGSRPLAKSSICEARQRLGPRAMMLLFRQLAKPLANPETCPNAFHLGLRMVSLDGTSIDVADSADNDRVFGRPSASRGRSAFPRMRVVGLIETGTHVWLDATVRPYGASEIPASHTIAGRSVTQGMLAFYDQGLHSYSLARLIVDRGGEIIGRVKHQISLPVLEVLPDGSYLSRLKGRTSRDRPIEVRVVEYQVGEKGERIRLVTTLLDWEATPAEKVAELYHERWEIELAYDEVKTHQRGRPNGHWVMLRSQKPALVVQELYGLLVAHLIVRSLMVGAAVEQKLDPRRISFKESLIILRRYTQTLANLAAEALPLFCPVC